MIHYVIFIQLCDNKSFVVFFSTSDEISHNQYLEYCTIVMQTQNIYIRSPVLTLLVSVPNW